MDSSDVIRMAGNSIYAIQGVLAVWGVYCVILVFRQIQRRTFRSEREVEAFLDTMRTHLEEGDHDAAVRLCDDPANFYRALPILARTAIVKRHLSPAKLRQTVAAKFEREILGRIENGRAAILTVAKSEPMLGLLGTVAGMIAAFQKIGSSARVDAQSLAGDISVALITTAVGLVVAVPMVIAASFIEVRMRGMEDATVEGMQVVLDDLEAVEAV
jgi:biopolymer transport protein ExbB/TolQ